MTDTLTAVATDNETTASLIDDIRSIRDRVTGRAMLVFGGRSRELAMVLTKLDEAELWMVKAGVSERSFEIVNIQKLQADAAGIAAIREAREHV
jgi:hypothetical protein